MDPLSRVVQCYNVKINILKLHLKMYKLEGQLLKQVAVIPINYIQLFKA
jgi:hypothetical protein